MNFVNVPTFRQNRRKSESRPRNEVRASGRNIKLTIEYEGTNYCGWQVQKSHQVTKSPRHQKKSIQEIIENTLSKILQERIQLIASGRTDAGVHALAQVANFKTNSNIALDKLKRALNGNLPDDIAINKIEEVNLDFHSRFHAKSKIYRYTILNRGWSSPLLRNAVYFYSYPLDVKLMRQEARCLLGRHDFKSFCASGSDTKTTVRTISKIAIRNIGCAPYAVCRTVIAIDIEADGFLYNMVRNIVGTLIEVGRGRFPRGSLKKILLSKNRKFAGPTVPACGLCLLKGMY